MEWQMKRRNALKKIYRCFLYRQLHNLKFHSRNLAATIGKKRVRPDGQSNKDHPTPDLMELYI